MNPTACSQTGCSGLAPAPELCPYGAPAAATSPCRALMNKPQPFFSTLTLISLLLNLTHTSAMWPRCLDYQWPTVARHGGPPLSFPRPCDHSMRA